MNIFDMMREHSSDPSHTKITITLERDGLKATHTFNACTDVSLEMRQAYTASEREMTATAVKFGLAVPPTGVETLSLFARVHKDDDGVLKSTETDVGGRISHEKR